ncbi:MAG TPA: extracellular solute-binding protein, partial [Actinomycetes bacterium]
MRTGQLTRLRTAGALALVASIALTGCGRDDEAGTDDVKSDKVGAGKASGDITVWALGAEGDKLGEIAADFEAANPKSKVNITVIPFDAAHNKIATAIAGNKTPDVSLVGSTWVSEFAASGALDATPTDLIDPSAFFEGAWGTTDVDGTSFGVPWYTETRQIYYRKDLAEKAGVTPGDDWNWDEFKAFTKAMQTEGGAKWGISLQPGGQGSWQTYMPFAWQQGAELVEGEEFTFNTPPMQEALDFYASFFTEKISPTDLAEGG